MAAGISKNRDLIMSLAIIAAGFIALFALSRVLEPLRPQQRPEWTDEDLALKGSGLKGIAFGAEGLIADWYWMRSLQYIGEKVLSSKDEFINVDDLRSLNPRLLYPYLDGATDLDPGFIAAYSYGALVLPAVDPEKAIALTRKGIANNPSQWRLYQYLGYIYWRLGRFNEAADAYSAGAQIAGAPSFMILMAGAMKNEGGGRETARSIFLQMSAEENDSETRYYGQLRLRQLESLDERDAVDSVLARFGDRNGRCVSGWNELLPLLREIKLPEGRSFRIDSANRIVDPSDAAYVLDNEKCRMVLDVQRTKIPLK